MKQETAEALFNRMRTFIEDLTPHNKEANAIVRAIDEAEGTLQSEYLYATQSLFRGYVEALVREYKSDPEHATQYNGSWIQSPLSCMDYAQLGTILGEAFILQEDGDAIENGSSLDRNTCASQAMEDFFGLRMTKIFVEFGVLGTGRNASNEPIFVNRLTTLVELVESDNEDNWKRIEHFRDSTAVVNKYRHLNNDELREKIGALNDGNPDNEAELLEVNSVLDARDEDEN